MLLGSVEPITEIAESWNDELVAFRPVSTTGVNTRTSG